MTLADRAAAAAKARPGDSSQRAVILAAALATAIAGIQLNEFAAVAAGAAVIGWLFRPEAERYYMEGFSHGLAAAAAIARAADPGIGDRGVVRGVPAGARAPDDPGADGPGSDAGSAARGGTEPADVAAAHGLVFESRSARNRVDDTGAPLPIGEGPRRAAFPPTGIVPAAVPSRLDSRQGRPENGRRARPKRA